MYTNGKYYYITESEIKSLVNESLRSTLGKAGKTAAKGIGIAGLAAGLGYGALMSPDYDYHNDPNYDAEAARQDSYEMHRADREAAQRREAEARGEEYKPNHDNTYEYGDGLSESIHRSLVKSIRKVLS